MSAEATIQRAIAELEAERTELDSKIAALRAVLTGSPGRSARGNGGTSSRRRSRRTMSASARKAVSARMKKYWAERRKAKAK